MLAQPLVSLTGGRFGYRRLSPLAPSPSAAASSSAPSNSRTTGGRWNASDQIPQRAVAEGMSRNGEIDPSDGGDSYRVSSWPTGVDALTLTSARASDVDYYYTSRLAGEPRGGIADVHLHPLEPRARRLRLDARF